VGINENCTSCSPSDTNGDIGYDAYVDVINQEAGLYDGNLNLLRSAPLSSLAGSSSTYAVDPEIIYDPSSNKFICAMMASQRRFLAPDWGFSTERSPTTPNQFCPLQFQHRII
jgi:hypothetical protein